MAPYNRALTLYIYICMMSNIKHVLMPFSAPLFIKWLVIFAYFLTTSQSASKRMHIISSSLRTANMTAIINNVTGYTENKVYPRIPEARGGGS